MGKNRLLDVTYKTARNIVILSSILLSFPLDGNLS